MQCNIHPCVSPYSSLETPSLLTKFQIQMLRCSGSDLAQSLHHDQGLGHHAGQCSASVLQLSVDFVHLSGASVRICCLSASLVCSMSCLTFFVSTHCVAHHADAFVVDTACIKCAQLSRIHVIIQAGSRHSQAPVHIRVQCESITVQY